MRYFSLRANFANKICLNKKKKKSTNDLEVDKNVVILNKN